MSGIQTQHKLLQLTHSNINKGDMLQENVC